MGMGDRADGGPLWNCWVPLSIAELATRSVDLKKSRGIRSVAYIMGYWSFSGVGLNHTVTNGHGDAQVTF